MMHVLIKEDLLDRSYIAKCTLGFEELKQRVPNGRQNAWQETCGISVDEVLGLARGMAKVLNVVSQV